MKLTATFNNLGVSTTARKLFRAISCVQSKRISQRKLNSLAKTWLRYGK